MIIDCHGHYTTEPKDMLRWRKEQVDNVKDPAKQPPRLSLKVSDDEIRESGASSKHRHGWKAPWCPIAIRSLLDRPPSRAMTAKERMTVKSEGEKNQWLNYRVSME